MKEKIAITIEGKLLARLDRAVNGETIRNRSHAIEHFLQKALGAKARKALVINTHRDFSSGMLFEGKPVAEHQAETFGKYGLGAEWREKEGMGTAHALALAKKELEQEEVFVAQYSHVVADIDFEDFATYHEQANAVTTVALTSIEDPSLYGSVKMRGEKIVGFTEKPKKKEGVSRVISAGIFCFSPEIFAYLPKDNRASLEKDVFPKLAKEGKLAGYMFEGKWCNVRNQVCHPAKKK